MRPAIVLSVLALAAAAVLPSPVRASSGAHVRASIQGEGLTIRDSLDREVTVPSRVRRVLSLQPEVTRIIVALGAGDRLIGMDYFLRRTDHLFKLIYPGEKRLPLVSMADYNVNLEIVMNLAPEVIFGAPEDARIVNNLQEKTRIPTVALSSMGRFSSLVGEIRLLGRILDREERAEALAARFQGVLARVGDGLAGPPPLVKPRVYLSFWGGLTKTPAFYEPVLAAGGVNVADGVLPSYAGTQIAVIGLEKLAAWDPDLILVHGNYPPGDRAVTVEGILADRRLSSLSAVRSGRVHYTFGFWNWWDPAQVLVETLYLAKLFHPGRFADLDLVREGNSIYRDFYGLEAGFSVLSRILGFSGWAHAGF